jgi:phosphonate transport system substrate-binding protein
MLSVYRAITDRVGIALGLDTELVVEADYDSCRNDVNDVCFVCSLPYVMFEREGVSPAVPVAAPILEGRRYGGRPVYYSDVIVAGDSDAMSFVDLRDRSWAYNEPLSHSGYGITRYHLVTLGETDGFFGEVIESGFHETSIRMVAEGEVDASAIDSQVLAVEFRDYPELAERLRVIDSLGPSTIQPVAISKRLDEDLREGIRGVLLDLHTTPGGPEILAHGLVERFVSVNEGDYDDIRSMVDVCEHAGFMTLA